LKSFSSGASCEGERIHRGREIEPALVFISEETKWFESHAIAFPFKIVVRQSGHDDHIQFLLVIGRFHVGSHNLNETGDLSRIVAESLVFTNS